MQVDDVDDVACVFACRHMATFTHVMKRFHVVVEYTQTRVKKSFKLTNLNL